ncbi:MAG: DUF1572 family protein [Gemmatimonadales bacterium]
MKNERPDRRHVVAAIEGEYRRYKALGEGTFSQLEPRELNAQTTPESLSIAMIVWHISGNLESRFTDFLTTDGEKSWRDRESEFAERRVDRKEMLAKWERGWSVLFDALAAVSDADLTRTVTIRGIPASVGEALERSLAHTSYHVGQITFLGKMLRRSGWKYLSIPPGKSAAYNANPDLEKARPPAAGKGASAKAPPKVARRGGAATEKAASKKGSAKKGAGKKPVAKKTARRTPPKKKARR